MLRPNRNYNAMIASRLTGQWGGGHASLHWAAVTARQGFFFPTTSAPAGYAAPRNGGMVAIRAGSISTRRSTSVTVGAVAVGAMGVGLAASADITLDATAIGGLIVSGAAIGSITVNGAAQIVATLGGIAAGSVVIGAVANINALALGSASASVVVTGAGQAMGLGFMVASTQDNVTLTPQSVATAVWASLIEGGHDASDILRILASIAAGKSSGHPSAPVFRNLLDTQDVVSGTVDANGNRTVTVITP